MEGSSPTPTHPAAAEPTRNRVGFVVAGAQKCGTTVLHDYLSTHPEICIAGEKELHFFNNDANFTGATVDYSRYHAAFHPDPGQHLFGESTPIYMYWSEAPKRLWKYNPRMKIVIILRNPVERAFSHWNMQRCRGLEQYPFLDALKAEAARRREASPAQLQVFSYMQRGFYAEQIERVWRYFPKDQCLIFRSEQLRRHPHETMNALSLFLGVAPFRQIEHRETHSLPYTHALKRDEKRYLAAIFEPEIRKLEQLLGWDCSDWRR